jgi:uncharacterized lipoprotein YmbA
MLATVVAALHACGSTPNPKLYLLEPMGKVESTADSDGATYLVGPFIVAERLNRLEIVNRDTRYRVTVDPLERWAEPLDVAVLSVLAENLTVLLDTERVIVYPWTFTDIADYVVRGNIHDFGPTSANEVTLDVSWMIGDGKGKVYELRRVNYTAASSGDGSAATVAAMSEALEDMSRDIAETIGGL